jgi:hypothetical protein
MNAGWCATPELVANSIAVWWLIKGTVDGPVSFGSDLAPPGIASGRDGAVASHHTFSFANVSPFLQLLRLESFWPKRLPSNQQA